jgi:aldehyde:ferredoxin oxidoreductase
MGLGTTNSKAVVVAGGEEPVIADPTALARLTGEYVSAITRNPLTSKQHDPPEFGAWPAEGLDGYLGVRNYTPARAHPPGFEASAFLARLGRSTGGCPGARRTA